jgi:hypothetical protein
MSLRVRSSLAAVALVVSLSGTLLAGDSTNLNKRAAGDGRGLATFGDRPLTTFSDRPLTTFGDRGFERFSEIPLAPMGGLIPGGVTVSGSSAGSSGRAHSSHRRSTTTTRIVPIATIGSSRSEVSFGSSFADDDLDATPTLLMPRVELPAVVLDHRPALALLEATLDDEVRRAAAAGDGDLARSLDPDRR